MIKRKCMVCGTLHSVDHATKCIVCDEDNWSFTCDKYPILKLNRTSSCPECKAEQEAKKRAAKKKRKKPSRKRKERAEKELKPSLKPHRGGTILTFGILSLFLCAIPFGCAAFAGVPAWQMAETDLREMKRGTMDPSGRGLTSVGHFFGIITTGISFVQVVWMFSK